MRDYIEERAIEIATYIIENKATVRQAARKFGISKSTVHVVGTKQNGLLGRLYKVIKEDQLANSSRILKIGR